MLKHRYSTSTLSRSKPRHDRHLERSKSLPRWHGGRSYRDEIDSAPLHHVDDEEHLDESYSWLGKNEMIGFRSPVVMERPSSLLKEPALRLHRAVWDRDCDKIVRLVEDRGVPVDAFNHLGQTPLFVACYFADAKVAKLLLRYGADPNARCYGGYTPTHGAFFGASRKVIGMLLEAGADMETQDFELQTPVDWVYEQADVEKQNKVLELIESVRRWTINAAVDCSSGGRSSTSSSTHTINNNNNTTKEGHSFVKASDVCYPKSRKSGDRISSEHKTRKSLPTSTTSSNKREAKRGSKESASLRDLSRRASLGTNQSVPSYPTKYRVKCTLLDENKPHKVEQQDRDQTTRETKTAKPKSRTENYGLDEVDCKPYFSFVDSAIDFDKRRYERLDRNHLSGLNSKEQRYVSGQDRVVIAKSEPRRNFDKYRDSLEEALRQKRERRNQFLNQSFGSIRELESRKKFLGQNERLLYTKEDETCSTDKEKEFKEKYKRLGNEVKSSGLSYLKPSSVSQPPRSKSTNYLAYPSTAKASFPRKNEPTTSRVKTLYRQFNVLEEEEKKPERKPDKQPSSPVVDRRSLFENPIFPIRSSSSGRKGPLEKQTMMGENVKLFLGERVQYRSKGRPEASTHVLARHGPPTTSTPNEPKVKNQKTKFPFPPPRKMDSLHGSFTSALNHSNDSFCDLELYRTLDDGDDLKESGDAYEGFVNPHNETVLSGGGFPSMFNEDAWNTLESEGDVQPVATTANETQAQWVTIANEITQKSCAGENCHDDAWNNNTECEENYATMVDDDECQKTVCALEHVEWEIHIPEQKSSERPIDVDEIDGNGVEEESDNNLWTTAAVGDDVQKESSNANHVTEDNVEDYVFDEEKPESESDEAWATLPSDEDDGEKENEEVLNKGQPEQPKGKSEIEENEATEAWQTIQNDGDATSGQEALNQCEVEDDVGKDDKTESIVPEGGDNSDAWNTICDANDETPEENDQNENTTRKESTWSFKGDEVEDLYCDDDLNGDDPNMQLQIAQHDEKENRGRYPPHPMLHDRESILSMDIPSTGPTSLRSNYTDDTEDGIPEEIPEDVDGDKTEDRFVTLTAASELSQARLMSAE